MKYALPSNTRTCPLLDATGAQPQQDCQYSQYPKKVKNETSLFQLAALIENSRENHDNVRLTQASYKPLSKFRASSW